MVAILSAPTWSEVLDWDEQYSEAVMERVARIKVETAERNQKYIEEIKVKMSRG